MQITGLQSQLLIFFLNTLKKLLSKFNRIKIIDKNNNDL